MTNLRKGPARRAHAERIRAWLSARPALLDDLPSASQDVTVAGAKALAAALEGLRADGLYSRRSEDHATAWGIRRHVSVIRGQAVDKQQRYFRTP